MNWACWEGAAHMPWSDMVVGPTTMIASLVIAGLAIAFVLRAFGIGWGAAPGRSALDVFKERFAPCEIDRAPYEDGKRLLSAP